MRQKACPRAVPSSSLLDGQGLRSVTAPTSNFAFLAVRSPKLARLGALAERYFADDAPASLVKLRQLAEFIAKDVAARQAALPSYDVSFDDVLRTLSCSDCASAPARYTPGAIFRPMSASKRSRRRCGRPSRHSGGPC